MDCRLALVWASDPPPPGWPLCLLPTPGGCGLTPGLPAHWQGKEMFQNRCRRHRPGRGPVSSHSRSAVGMPGALPCALPSLRVVSPPAFPQLARLSAKTVWGATWAAQRLFFSSQEADFWFPSVSVGEPVPGSSQSSESELDPFCR